MPDIRLVERSQDIGIPSFKHNAIIDWSVTPDRGVDETQELSTAVMIALGSDHVAYDSDTLPDNYSNDLRGWWGDLNAREIWDGWDVGCRLWEMERDKVTFAGYKKGATSAKIYSFIAEGIQPMVDRLIIHSYEAKIVDQTRERIVVSLTLNRIREPAVTLQFAILAQGLLGA